MTLPKSCGKGNRVACVDAWQGIRCFFADLFLKEHPGGINLGSSARRCGENALQLVLPAPRSSMGERAPGLPITPYPSQLDAGIERAHDTPSGAIVRCSDRQPRFRTSGTDVLPDTAPARGIEWHGFTYIAECAMSPTNTTDRRGGEALTCFLILATFVSSMVCRDDQAALATPIIGLDVNG